MVYRLHGFNLTIARHVVLASSLLLSACAHQNALLQSPQANTTESIDQINAELDKALAADNVVGLESIPDDVMNALTPEAMTLPSVKAVSEPRLDIAVRDVPARDFFAELVSGSRYNMLVDPAIEGTISLDLKDVTVDEVLQITHRLYGYEYEKEGRLIHVTAPGLRTHIFAINYLNVARDGDSETRVSSGQITQSNSSSDSSSGAAAPTRTVGSGTRISTRNEHRFWETLGQTLELIVGDKEGHSVIITPTTGMAVVRADANSLADVKRYLERADLILKRQVILEAKILEVSLSKGYQQGIDWSFSEASSSLDSDGEPKRGIGLQQTAQAIATDAAGVFASALKFNNFETTINLLGTQGNVQVLSSPRIATVNNQKAVIKVGSDEFYVTDIDFQSNDDTNSDSTDIELTPFFSGIALDVTPQISEDGKIILHVHPTISKVQDQTKTISINGQDTNLPLALSSIRESDSIITAENGQIVVIGGLIQNRSSDSNGSVPFFGDIPLLGELFKQKKETSEKTELVILLRPTLTDQQAIQRDIRASRERFGRFRERMAAPTDTGYDE
jgi:MSHA biogenesis protein MshL